MNHQEAITIIEANRPRSGYPKLHTACGVAIKTLEAMPEYEKLKERDRAMKPNGETNFYPDGSFEYSRFCPVCRCDFGEDEVNFCWNCGQRIDWSEEES